MSNKADPYTVFSLACFAMAVISLTFGFLIWAFNQLTKRK